MRDNSKFRQGSGVYVCKMCGKRTRETGEGESGIDMCRACCEYSGAENTHSDCEHDESPEPGCPICEGVTAPWDL